MLKQIKQFMLVLLISNFAVKAEPQLTELQQKSLEEITDKMELAIDSLLQDDGKPMDEVIRRKRKKKFCSIVVDACAKIGSLVVCGNACINGRLAVGGGLAVRGASAFSDPVAFGSSITVAGGATFGGPVSAPSFVIGGTTITATGGSIFPGNVIFEGATITPLNVIGNSAEIALNLRRGTVNPLAGPAGTSAVVRGAGYTAVTTTTDPLLGVVPLGSSVSVTFTPAYASVPTVVVSLEGVTAVPGLAFTVEVTGVTTAGFTATVFNTVTGLPVALPAGALINFIAVAPQV